MIELIMEILKINIKFKSLLVLISIINIQKSIYANVIPSKNSKNLFKLVVFSFDGFRHDYIDPIRTPNLYAISQAGVQGKMESTFVTKTFSNHQSIATGLYEPWHGITNNNFFDPKMNNVFNVNDPSYLWWDQYNISVPIYIANQYYEPNRYSISIQWPGSISYYTNGKNHDQRKRVHYLQNYDEKIDWFKRIDLLIKWLSDPEEPANLAFVYYSEPDTHAHQFGPFSEQVYEQVRNLDKVVEYFRLKLIEENLAHRTNVIYLSDHGMAEINANRSLYLDKCDKEFVGLKYKMYGTSPVFSINPISGPNSETKQNYSIAKSVRDALNECAEKFFHKKFKAYLQEEIPESFHYKNNARILPVFLMADEGYDINYEDKGWKPTGYPTWGNHGYNQSLPSMRPLFLAEGPRFKRQYYHPVTFENIDLYPLMLNLLDIPQNYFITNNGSFDRVRQMLTNQLYLDVQDVLADKSSNTVWIRLFLYLICGFSFIFIAGSCLVFGAGLNKQALRSSTINRSNESHLGGYLRRIWNKNKHSEDHTYHMFANQRPTNHLDSSSTSSLDDDEIILKNEYELFRKPRDQNPRPSTSGNNSNQLTEIDWDIIGTGLDIDLASQIDDGKSMMPESSRNEYLDKHKSNYIDDDDDEIKEKFSKSSQARESVSLLLSDDDGDDDHNDFDPRKNEEIKAKINIKEYEELLLQNDDDDLQQKPDEILRRPSESNKLIDI